VVLLATETVIAEGVRQTDLAAAKNIGARIAEEGLDGKILFRVDGVARAFELVEFLLSREVGAVSPNFLRRVIRPQLSRPAAPWAHQKIGVREAWKITKGDSDVRVAVLDEGVDTTHPALRDAVVSQRDFIGGNGNSAMPDGDDAHGTACAGIAVSRDDGVPGIAPRCSLIAARIAMDDGTGHWVFDDFATSDAIDWCWRQGAAVLSNSWGGGAPSDAIARSFGRARTQGRNGLGAVIAIAAGNFQIPIDFPGNLPGYVTVGASTPKDERKTKTSSDGERWGSNYGPTLSLLAPGVFISTTDIAGPRGYDPGDFTQTFNGTSSATPHVAAAAALMLSANPGLSAPTVRDLLGQTAKRIAGQTGWTPELGFGRLDVARAVSMAKNASRPAKRRARSRKPAHREKKRRRP
jgi:subtilisin family serine protease